MYDNYMKKSFYNHLVTIDSLTIELDKIEMSQDEKRHLILLIDSNIHQTVLNVVLSELQGNDKKIFLHHLSSGDHDKAWIHLKGKIENVENKIKKAADEIIKELHEDIKKIKS